MLIQPKRQYVEKTNPPFSGARNVLQTPKVLITSFLWGFIVLYGWRKTKMTNIAQGAKEYQPPTTKNVADLKKVSVNLELLDFEDVDAEGNKYKYKYFMYEGEKYRVPGSVLGGLKAIMEKMPDLQYFSVIKSGSGMQTKYQVIPFTETQTKVGA